MFIFKAHTLRRLFVLGLFAGSVASQAVQIGPNPTLAALKADGPFAVSTQTISGTGQAFGSATVYSPNTAGKYAVIAVCPGFLMPQSAIQPLGRRLATHGFVVVTIGTKSLTDVPNSRATQLLGALKATTSLTTGPVVGKVDASRQGVAGWSMGGGGALAAAGTTPGLMSALGWAPFNPDTSAIPQITVPTAILNGTNDTITPLGPYAQSYYNMIPATTKKALGVIQGATHFVFSFGVNEPVGYTSIAWTKRFADGDTRYSAFLPATLSDWASFTSNGPF